MHPNYIQNFRSKIENFHNMGIINMTRDLNCWFSTTLISFIYYILFNYYIAHN